MLPPNQGKQIGQENAGVAPPMPRTARSSILVGYAQLAQSLGLDPAFMLDSVGIDRRCLLDREVHIPVIAAAQLLERSALETSVFDFGLRLAEIRGTPDLGPLNPLLREEPNLRRALQSLERYFSVHSTGLAVQIVQAGAPIPSASFIAGELGPTRQSREMIVASLFKFKYLLGWGSLRSPSASLKTMSRGTTSSGRIFSSIRTNNSSRKRGLKARACTMTSMRSRSASMTW